ncbi:hypothetical protein SAMN04487944_106131 [Gracilibacillus ureilyticus]|uniref:Uncharacterized protein n=1 Tax=Gracilibacillus ureilyticus TaxID=531814 RepID=A0A1H9QCD8_9BACI|nr:tetratricopeptide repeat protein [Gracilibacillus ureilyticus]SER58088.1 hypothetical protein SAMN04487944_106131 [Gracilibacillus ureilyticus]
MTTITFLHHKKPLKMNVMQLTLFKQAKIVELTDKNNQCYTAIFYKDKFINAKKLNAIKLHSFLKRALTNGIQYPSKHPLTRAFLSPDKKYRITTSNQMFQNLKDKYTDIEMLYVLSMFDNFLDQKKISALCKKIFYQYRRNGQMKLAFRTIVNYALVRPHDRFATDMLHHMDFQKYQETYSKYNQLVSNWTDSLYIEAVSADYLTSNAVINQLLQFYQKEERWFDSLSLRYQLFQTSHPPFSSTDLEQFETELKKLNNKDITESFWRELLKLDPASDRIIRILSENDSNETIVSHALVTGEKMDLEVFEKALLTAEGELLKQYKSQLFPYITSHYKSDQTKMEKLIHYCTRKLLPHISITEILEHLSAVELPVITKLKNMKQLEQNPDEQYALGEIYYHLEQYDKAIQCFEWEMELSPDDPKPLQYLQKSYYAIGDLNSAKDYQELLVNMSSRTRTS